MFLGAHGGFSTSLLWHAVLKHFETTLAKYSQPDSISLHVEFLRPATLGEVSISVKDAKLGRGTSTVHARLVQGGKERVAGYVTNINRASSKGITMSMGFQLDPQYQPSTSMPCSRTKTRHGSDSICLTGQPLSTKF